MRATIATLAVLVMVSVGIAAVQPIVAAPRIPACVEEDQAVGPCYWNAQVQGNGQGQSFTVDADGWVTYLEEK